MGCKDDWLTISTHMDKRFQVKEVTVSLVSLRRGNHICVSLLLSFVWSFSRRLCAWITAFTFMCTVHPSLPRPGSSEGRGFLTTTGTDAAVSSYASSLIPHLHTCFSLGPRPGHGSQQNDCSQLSCKSVFAPVGGGGG